MTTRREAIAGLAGLFLAGRLQAAPAAGRGQPFSWDWLQQRAQTLSREAWRAPPPPHASVERIDYDSVGQIEYRADRTLWGDGGVRFFPQTKMAPSAVSIMVVERGVARPFDYASSLYRVPRGHPLAAVGSHGGFSGFRVMNPGGRGDWLAFQGASYFRTAGPLSQYGLSARGLAINSGTVEPEEFPAFTSFWLERGADGMPIVYALLDGPSVTGAYRFLNRRTDDEIVQDVSAVVFMRNTVARLGMAALTSMFWYGEGDRAKAVDWRPEIHDSDGLAIHTGSGERIWRPLGNPSRPLTSSFVDENPRGFGLLQRDRNFDHYQDDAVFYEKRPSLWVEPKGDWGKGAVTLYEFPATREYDDNVVAYWTPAASPGAGARLAWDYRLRWIGGEPAPMLLARAVDFWRGQGNVPGQPPGGDTVKFVVDFEGERFAGLNHQSPVTPDVTIRGGKAVNVGCYPVDTRKNLWRFVVDIQRTGDKAVDARVCLRLQNQPITETWLYTLT